MITKIIMNRSIFISLVSCFVFKFYNLKILQKKKTQHTKLNTHNRQHTTACCVLRVACCVLLNARCVLGVVCYIFCAFDCSCVCLVLRLFVCMSACVRDRFLLRHYSTSPLSGNQVDGLPLVLHKTRAVVLGPPLRSALFNDNWEKLYCESNIYDAYT